MNDSNSRSLFLLPLSEIKIDDIESFCYQKISEGSTIDYKKELIKEKILPTIAAMANTDGGLILVGVSEEKEQGGRRSHPGLVEGINNRDPKQTIINWCYAFLQPAFCPEIQEVPVGNGEKVIVFIRIYPELVPELPVFYREKGILIRLDEENRLADPMRIRLLFEEDKNRKSRIATNINSWLSGGTPNLPDFYWCSLGLFLPMRKFIGQMRWNSERIEQLRKAIKEHQIGRIRTWTQKWSPLPFKESNPIRRKDLSFRMHPSEIRLRRKEKDVLFYPDPCDSQGRPLGLEEPDPEREKYFQVWFNVQGYMRASVGLSWKPDGVRAEEILGIFYSVLDLFTQNQVKECFPDCLWENGKFTLFAQVSQFPGTVRTSWIDEELPEDFPSKGSSWSGPYETEIVDTLEPEKIAKEYTSRFLAWVGFLHYENNLQKFDIKGWLGHL